MDYSHKPGTLNSVSTWQTEEYRKNFSQPYESPTSPKTLVDILDLALEKMDSEDDFSSIASIRSSQVNFPNSSNISVNKPSNW